MKYNVAQLLKEPIGSQRNVNIEEEICDAEHPMDHVRGTVDMVRTHQGIWVKARLVARVPQNCSRCLDAFPRTLRIELDEEYFPEVDFKTGFRAIPPDDWEGLCIGADHNLDLSEATRQTTLATLPLKPLCKPDCIGICDRCGCNRNEVACDCYSRAIDPRWEALRSLIDERQT